MVFVLFYVSASANKIYKDRNLRVNGLLWWHLPLCIMNEGLDFHSAVLVSCETVLGSIWLSQTHFRILTFSPRICCWGHISEARSWVSS